MTAPHPSVGWVPFASSPRVASVRLRCHVPNSYLQEAGWQSELFQPRSLDRYRILVFQKAYEDEHLELAANSRRRGVKVAFDLCDNHFYNPDGRPDFSARADRLRKMIELADVVTVPTGALADAVAAPHVRQVDDALDPTAIHLRTPPLPSSGLVTERPLRLVWFGNAGSKSPSFGLVDLAAVLPALEEVHRERPLELTIISNSRSLYRTLFSTTRLPTRYVTWRPRRFAPRFAGHDVCILPISPNPFTICKSSNRVVTSLVLGVPVVATMIPSYEALASYLLPDDWPASLRTYAVDGQRRVTHVREGQAYVRAAFGQDEITRQWVEVFESL